MKFLLTTLLSFCLLSFVCAHSLRSMPNYTKDVVLHEVYGYISEVTSRKEIVFWPSEYQRPIVISMDIAKLKLKTYYIDEDNEYSEAVEDDIEFYELSELLKISKIYGRVVYQEYPEGLSGIGAVLDCPVEEE